MMDNSLMIIFPYLYKDSWVFDDEKTGLIKEPFVFGIPEMIDFLVNDIQDAEHGFKLIFASIPFPSYQYKLTWIREEYGGNWYSLEGNNEGWLCPALLKYFDFPPSEIYVKALPVTER